MQLVAMHHTLLIRLSLFIWTDPETQSHQPIDTTKSIANIVPQKPTQNAFLASQVCSHPRFFVLVFYFPTH